MRDLVMYEVELKLQIPKQKKAQIQKAVQALSPQTIALHAQYFDTDDFILAQHFIAIRLRKEHQAWTQTLKSAGKNALERYENDVHRGEFSDVPALDLTVYEHDVLATKALQPIIHNGQFLPVRMQFETVVERTYQVVEHQGAQIEICLDLGHLGNSTHQEEICEIEFELVSGSPLALIDLVQIWVKKYGIWLDIRSKAERGNLIARSLLVSPAKKTTYPIFSSHSRLAEAFPRFLLHYTQSFLPHLAAIADQIAEREHYIQAEKSLAHVLYLTTEFDAEQQWIASQHVQSLQHIQKQLQHYLALSAVDQRLNDTLTEHQLSGLSKGVTQLQAQLAKDIITSDVTWAVLELLQLGFKDATVFADDLPNTSWHDALKQQHKQIKNSPIYTVFESLSDASLSTIVKLDLLHHYLNKKSYVPAKFVYAAQDVIRINLADELIAALRMLKTEQFLLTGWLLAEKEHTLKRYEKQWAKLNS